MKLLVISSAPFITKTDGIYAYSPYVKEMEIWRKNVDELLFCCPYRKTEGTLLITKIPFKIDAIYYLQEFNFTTIGNAIKALPVLIKDCILLYKNIKKSDTIHLRCPGNIGLLACFIQILFPNKIKTAKYAGNWDPNAKQPLSYRFQKWILSNTFLTKNMQVLVYGEWKNSSKNIRPFFTASYFEKEKIDVKPRKLEGKISFIFVGTLSNGKQPLYAIRLIEQLHKNANNVQLTLYGEGKERAMIESYISENNLNNIVFLKGNQNQETIKNAYCENHFVILPSLSEGWPKVVSEGMFWGCLPIANKVSCVPNMLENGKRGILLDLKLNQDVQNIEQILKDSPLYQDKVNRAVQWSRQFTMDVFEEEIKLLLKS